MVTPGLAEERSFSQLVVVGSSAGGIEALSQLVSALPEEFPAPIVIAQHLDPERKSHLQQILSRRSTLPVKTLVDNEPLEAGVVFVVPANYHVNITDSEISLHEDHSGRPKPSVDRLMRTASEVFGERLIAVVLSGTGTDGTEGARAVRRAGGTVVIQDPETAEFGGMPGSLAPNTVDVVAQLDRIGPVLGDLLSEAESVSGDMTPEEERRALISFLEELRDQHGVDFTSYKTPTIMRRLKRRMVDTETGSVEEYVRYFHEHPEEYRKLVDAFLIKVTQFFRDPDLFAYLKEEILPELIRDARNDMHQLRIWSAGCATGEEAYSLAILLSEILGDEMGMFNTRIFATDVDVDAVTFARHGMYPPSALKSLSEEQVERYFTREGSQYQINKQIRSMIVFGEHDLARRSPFPRIDLVVSRNVLIYFTPELQRRALRLFAYSLRDGGYLALGKAETTTPLPNFFASQHRHHKVYKRHGERFLMPPTTPVAPAPPARRRRGNLVQSLGAQDTTSDLLRELRQSRLADETFLNDLPVGVVVVNRRYDIQAINAAARRLLSIRGVAVDEDFLHLLQNVPYTEVRRAIDTAFRDGGHAHTGEFTAEDAASGEPRYLQIVCHPRRYEGEEGPAQTVTVVVSDVTELGSARREMGENLERTKSEFERFRREAEAESERQRRQTERLVETNRQLEEANDELTHLNEELRVANEEAQLSSEEAQASTEEVETLNEELQATNEELETLNEELQATVEELNTTNDDLQARSAELQELAQAREGERWQSEESRRRLEAVLVGMSDAVLAVGAGGEVLFKNDAFVETFGEISDDHSSAELLGNHVLLDEAGEKLSQQMTPRFRASRGESFQMRFAIEGDPERRFDVRGRPIEDGEMSGGVIVIREVVDIAGDGRVPEDGEASDKVPDETPDGAAE